MACTRLTRSGPMCPLLSLAPSLIQLQPRWLPCHFPNTACAALILPLIPASGQTFPRQGSFPAHLSQTACPPLHNTYTACHAILMFVASFILTHSPHTYPWRWTIILFTVEFPSPGIWRSSEDICWLNGQHGLAENCWVFLDWACLGRLYLSSRKIYSDGNCSFFSTSGPTATTPVLSEEGHTWRREGSLAQSLLPQ